MPAVDGLEFRAAQKDDSANAGIPLMSADLAAVIDADAHLRKPYDPEMFMATIGDLLLARGHKSRSAQADRGRRGARDQQSTRVHGAQHRLRPRASPLAPPGCVRLVVLEGRPTACWPGLAVWRRPDAERMGRAGLPPRVVE
jgi:hypothetical protein